jgi:hypothetical protein
LTFTARPGEWRAFSRRIQVSASQQVFGGGEAGLIANAVEAYIGHVEATPMVKDERAIDAAAVERCGAAGFIRHFEDACRSGPSAQAGGGEQKRATCE